MQTSREGHLDKKPSFKCGKRPNTAKTTMHTGPKTTTRAVGEVKPPTIALC